MRSIASVRPVLHHLRVGEQPMNQLSRRHDSGEERAESAASGGCMNLHQAVTLIQQKFTEEMNGTTSGETADNYRAAMAAFPATMALAHVYLAMEYGRRMPMQ